MFDFILRKPVIQSAQSYLEKLKPEVKLHVPPGIPLPSVSLIKRMAAIVSKINGLEATCQALSNEQMRAKTDEFKIQLESKLKEAKTELLRVEELLRQATVPQERDQLILELSQVRDYFKKTRHQALDEILPEAFALVREAGKRVLNMRHFDVQLLGGMVLHEGKIAEMTTGEGKTLVATLPAYLNALTQQGVHVITVNDYLAKRDREWMGPIYEFLGLTVGVIQHHMDPIARQQAYGCDITYGTNNEFGFDYLRDNMVVGKNQMVQRGHHFAIVDEVDSILVDEARTPLIISGPAEESTDKYYRANEIVKKLKGRRVTEKEEIEAKHKNEDLGLGFEYVADEKAKSISLTDAGEQRAAELFGIANMHEMETIEYRHHVLQALRAKEFFSLDVDYVIRDGHVVIVDEFTGRMMPGRRWSDGLHQAVEAKEKIKIERENQTLATVTFQNYFRMYDKLSGMTGTANTEANEFKQIYNLDCVVVPTNRKLTRTNYPDAVYKTVKEKFNAVVNEIEELHKKGQPVLVGTISIEKSEILSRMLKAKGIPHQVLNAKYHDLEAHIIAQAGRYKAVTIATNMAGRGTDILLGGNVEHLAKSLAEQKVKESKETVNHLELVAKFIEQFKQQVKEEHEKVVALGGLHVLGTERHESRRIDNQLRGRCGRQGDPGSSRFYISLEDDLMRLFAGDKLGGMMEKIGLQEGDVIEHPWVTNVIEVAQKRVEAHNFDIRKQLLEYDNVMNKQREAIYSLRQAILEADHIRPRIVVAIEESAYRLVEQYAVTEGTEFDVEGLRRNLQKPFGVELTQSDDVLKNTSKEDVRQIVQEALLSAYQQKEQRVPVDQLRFLEKMIFLHTIDSNWKDHLYAMDQLKDGISLRAYGQRDPLIEYKREGFSMFSVMFDSINQEVVESIFGLEPIKDQPQLKGVFDSIPQQLVHDEISGLSSPQVTIHQEDSVNDSAMTSRLEAAPSSSVSPQRSGPKVGRNDPCPCGSGKKYKKCCGQ